MNIDDTMSILRKNTWKLRGYTYKITHISAAYRPIVANMVSTYCYVTVFIATVIYSSCLIYIFMKININIRTKRKMAEKIKGYTYKITNIPAAYCPNVANIMLNSSLCITVLLSVKI